MQNEGLHRKLSEDGCEGGLILDEMSIQSDLQFYSKNGKKYLVGFTEVLDESILMNSIHSGKKEVKLATHVSQFIFLGFTGFRFPLFHFPTTTASAAELNLLFWKIVNLLITFGFNKVHTKDIFYEMDISLLFRNAYLWDISNNPFPVH